MRSSARWLVTHFATHCDVICALLEFNVRSEFSIKICARLLIKIDHVIFIYVTTPHSESAVLAIIHENRALLNSDRIFKGLETVSSCFAYKYKHCIQYCIWPKKASCSIENFSFIVCQRVRVCVNKTLTTVSNPKIHARLNVIYKLGSANESIKLYHRKVKGRC